MLGCLCCGGWVGDRAQAPIFKVLSCAVPVQGKRVRVLAPDSALFLVFFRSDLVDFCRRSLVRMAVAFNFALSVSHVTHMGKD